MTSSEPLPTEGLAPARQVDLSAVTLPLWLVFVAVVANFALIFYVEIRGPLPPLEYRIESPSDYELAREMSKFGREGWSVVSARRATGDRGASYEVILCREVR